MSDFDIVQEFRAAMLAHGLETPDPIIPNLKKLRRIHIVGDKRGKKNGWYFLRTDGHPAGAFGTKKGDLRVKWSSKQKTEPLTREERDARREAIRRRQLERDAEQAMAHELAAEHANRLWDAAEDCTTHPYLDAKQVPAIGLKVGRFERIDQDTGQVILVSNRALLIPVRNPARRIVSLQAIYTDPRDIHGFQKAFLVNGEKKGKFFSIGKPIDNVILICEGVATGLSLHVATGYGVIVAFDTSNLLPVAKEARRCLPESKIVIAADNDKWTLTPVVNPGVHYGMPAAHAVTGVMAIPVFADESSKPSDFNDLCTLEGPDAVKRLITAALKKFEAEPEETTLSPGEPPEAKSQQELDDEAEMAAAIEDPYHDKITDVRFRVLGYEHQRYFIYSHGKRQVLCYTKSDFGEAGFIELADFDWWKTYFPASGGKGFDKIAATNYLIRLAEKRGIFNPNIIRGRGAWTDGGRSIYHHGSYLTVDGAHTEVCGIRSRHVYELGDPLPKPAAEMLSDDEAAELLDVATHLQWEVPASAILLMGWIVLAPFCGALDWRPHVWVTGPAGVGKSTVLRNLIRPLLNGSELFVAGASTEAGIRQTLGSDARPVVFDEIESNDQQGSDRVNAHLALMRQSSTETGATIIKGSSAGIPTQYRIRSMYLLASVRVAALDRADTDRITMLNLRPHGASNCVDNLSITRRLEMLAANRTIGARLMRRSLTLLRTILANIVVFRDAVTVHLGRRRDGDQLGTLLAGAWSLRSTKPATREDAQAFINEFDWNSFRDGGTDGETLLNAILSARVRVTPVLERTVAELLRNTVSPSDDSLSQLEAHACLQRFGIRVIERDKDLKVLFAKSHRDLARLAAGSSFERDVCGQLSRLTGAWASKSGQPFEKERFAGTTLRYVALPIELVLGDQESEKKLQQDPDGSDTNILPFPHPVKEVDEI